MDLQFYPKQYLALTTEADEILYGGAAGSGKSFLLRYAALLFCFYIPGIQVYLFRRKYADLLQNHLYGPSGFLAILEEFVQMGLCQINLSNNRIDFFHPNHGAVSQIFLRHMQHEKDMYNYQGSEMHVAMFDELTHFTEKMYKFIRTRVRVGSFKVNYKAARKNLPFIYDGYFPRILAASNPGNIGHASVKRGFIDPVPPCTVWQTSPKEGGMKRVFIPAFLHENIKLIEEDPTYADKLRGAGGSLVEALLKGNWEIAEGGAVADVWDESVHVLEPFEIPKNARIVRCCDWGTFHPSVILYVLISNGEVLKYYDGTEFILPKGSQIVIKEIYNWNGEENEGSRISANEVGKQLARFEWDCPWKNQIRKGPADNQIFANRGGTYQTIDDLITEGYNEEMTNIAQEEKGYSWPYNVNGLFERADQSQNSRVQGLNLVRAYLIGATSGDKKGLYFVNTCRHCIRTIPHLPRDESNPEDVDTDSEDHCFDTVKYCILAQRFQYSPLDIKGF